MYINWTYPPNIDGYSYKMFYVSLIITTKQKPIAHTKKIKRKVFKHAISEKSNYKGGYEEKKKKWTKILNYSHKTGNKMWISQFYQ